MWQTFFRDSQSSILLWKIRPFLLRIVQILWFFCEKQGNRQKFLSYNCIFLLLFMFFDFLFVFLQSLYCKNCNNWYLKDGLTISCSEFRRLKQNGFALVWNIDIQKLILRVSCSLPRNLMKNTIELLTNWPKNFS